MCKEIFRKIPIFMLDIVGKFHCGYWYVLEMSTVPVSIHMLENSVSPVVWSCDIHHICWNFASVLVTVHDATTCLQNFTYNANDKRRSLLHVRDAACFKLVHCQAPS